jgi:hypothetical protein
MGKRLATAVQETWVKTFSTKDAALCEAKLEIIPTSSGTKLISSGTENGKRHYRDIFTENEIELNKRRAALIQDGYTLTTKQVKLHRSR